MEKVVKSISHISNKMSSFQLRIELPVGNSLCKYLLVLKSFITKCPGLSNVLWSLLLHKLWAYDMLVLFWSSPWTGHSVKVHYGIWIWHGTLMIRISPLASIKRFWLIFQLPFCCFWLHYQYGVLPKAGTEGYHGQL